MGFASGATIRLARRKHRKEHGSRKQAILLAAGVVLTRTKLRDALG
jgi:hypothetical protein